MFDKTITSVGVLRAIYLSSIRFHSIKLPGQWKGPLFNIKLSGVIGVGRSITININVFLYETGKSRREKYFTIIKNVKKTKIRPENKNRTDIGCWSYCRIQHVILYEYKPDRTGWHL